jgi:hypothetical protein
LVEFGQILSLLQGFENTAHRVEILCLWRPYVDQLYMWRERGREKEDEKERDVGFGEWEVLGGFISPDLTEKSLL